MHTMKLAAHCTVLGLLLLLSTAAAAGSDHLEQPLTITPPTTVDVIVQPAPLGTEVIYLEELNSGETVVLAPEGHTAGQVIHVFVTSGKRLDVSIADGNLTGLRVLRVNADPWILPHMDADGDGHDDDIEVLLGSDPGDPFIRSSVGDSNGDGITDLEDAMHLFRRGPTFFSAPFGHDNDFDVNGDYEMEEDDARAIFDLATGRLPVIPAQALPAE